ncbi:MAG: hypothetical protein AABX47_06605 [Nanoarchaeota archaeon]
MARFVPESTKKQVKAAVKSESEKRPGSSVNAVSTKKDVAANPLLPLVPTKVPPPSDNYIPMAVPPKKEDVKKEVKASIDSIVSGKDSPPPDTNKRVIDALISTTAPDAKPPSADAEVKDLGAAYRQNAPVRQDNPADVYRAIAGPAQGSQDGPGSIYRGASVHQEDTNQLRQYVNKDAHRRNLDSQGQSDIFGTQEHTLSGRIKKMYSRN